MVFGTIKVMKNWLLFGISYLLLSFSSVAAAGDFYTTYNVSHDIGPDGIAQVTEKISQKNLVSRVYSTQYQVTIPSQISYVSGFDSRGTLKITALPVPQGTQITAFFNDQVVGLGQTLNFTLNYRIPSAIKRGQIWEVTIPKLGNPEIADSYSLKLTVPESFGLPAYMYPYPKNSLHPVYIFSKEQLIQSAISASFGNFQSFSFKLDYHLENPTGRSQTQTIALPPDTYYQKILLTDLDPAPQKIDIDPDGNWLAVYRLSRRQKLDITVNGQAQVRSQPIQFGLQVDDSTLDRYLSPDVFWPVNDPRIKSLAQQLSTPQKIFTYVVNNLTYDPARLSNPTRRGALSALTDPDHSLCTDFTDLFITLARSAGIPAREVQGYASSSDSVTQPLSLVADVLHSWPQYWDPDKQMWIDIDPTWENTSRGTDYFNKFDFNHLAFVIHGSSSQKPLSPGFYKLDSSSQDISVQPSIQVNVPTVPPRLTVTPPWQIFPWSSTALISVQNANSSAIYRLPISVHSTGVKIVSPPALSITALPPHSFQILPVKLSGTFLPHFSPSILTVEVGSQQIIYNIPSNHFLFWHVLVSITISLTFISLVWVAHRSWSISHERSTGENSLRR